MKIEKCKPKEQFTFIKLDGGIEQARAICKKFSDFQILQESDGWKLWAFNLGYADEYVVFLGGEVYGSYSEKDFKEIFEVNNG